MFNQLDSERVFSISKELGYSQCEIYAEAVFHTCIRSANRLEESGISVSGGVAIWCSNGRTTHHFSASSFDTPTLINLLRNTKEPPSPPTIELGEMTSLQQEHQATQSSLTSKQREFSEFSRQIWPENSTLNHPNLIYQDKVKLFETSHSDGTFASGREEEAAIEAQWIIKCKDNFQQFRKHFCRGYLSAFFNDLQNNNVLAEGIRHSLEVQTPWPTPKGEMSILWSSRAISKLCQCFLKCFEGDLVLGNNSFLTKADFPIELSFSVFDNPNPSQLPIDHEGSPRRPLSIFDEGRPKGLACNREMANQMHVSSTGHCRRESFEFPKTVGFWNPEIHSPYSEECLLSKVMGGLEVCDLEVLSFDPHSTNVTLQLNEVSLIHNGEKGECVKPILLHMNLLELLKTLKQFSKTKTITGLPVQKRNQSYLTEFTCPDALSPRLEIPGEVPASNYW